MSESYFNDINEVTLIGCVARDAEKVDKTTKEGKTFSYVRVVVATNREWSTKEGEKHSSTDFNTIYFNASDMTMAAKLRTGVKVFIRGRLKQRSYEKDGEKRHVLDIVAQYLRIVDWTKSGDKNKQIKQQYETANQTK